ncbi:hypothetical protein PoHVEF18_008117 [Penicillium ochrochloron]
MVATGGLYAPTIRHQNGVTYIICTYVIHSTSNKFGDEHDEQFIIHTTDILSGNWSDPIIFPFTPGIDPSLLFDDDQVYVQLCKIGPKFQIFNFEIDITTGTMLTEPALIWNGWAGSFTEGPHVYKKDGWYYLSCAEGGTFRHHMLSIARSKSIWGPYEAYDKNPLYSADGTDEYVQNTGHGDFFQDKRGEWWVVMLGVRMDEGRCIMGRESFLAAVKWPANEWPSIDTVAARRELPALPGQTGVAQFPLPSTDSAAWVYLRDAVLEDYRIQDSQVTMRAHPAGLDSVQQVVSFVGQRQRRLIGRAGVTLHRPERSQTSPDGLIRAGLAFYKDEHRFLSIAYDFQADQIVFEGRNPAKSYSAEQTQQVKTDNTIKFQIRYTERSMRFYIHIYGGHWQCMQEVDTLMMTDFDFTGPVIGIFAVGNGGEVKFTDFEIDVVTDIGTEDHTSGEDFE